MIYIYHVGDISKISKLTSKLKELNITYEVGPTNQDQKKLMKVKFYKDSYDQGIWSFCSDIWRLYKLRTQKGMYIDTSVEIGDNFSIFYENAIKHKTYLVKQNLNTVASSVMASGVDNNDFFSEIYDIFCHIKFSNVRFVPLIMEIMTANLTSKNIFTKGPAVIKKNDFFIDTLKSIRDINSIFKYGSGSWILGNNNDNKFIDTWKPLENGWDKGRISDISERVVNRIVKYGYNIVEVNELKFIYELTESREVINLCKNEYKKIPYRLLCKERLIWSKLLRVFLFKWFKKKRKV